MKNKTINQITLLSCLLVGSIANAETFYQCVPKADYIKNKAKEVIRNESWLEDYLYKMEVKNKIKYAEKNMNNEKMWLLIENNVVSGLLNMGIYKVEVAGGAGGNGGLVNNGSLCDDETFDREYCKDLRGGKGGVGEVVVKMFDLKQSQYFTSCIGKKGQDGVHVDDKNHVIGAGGGTSGGGGGAGSGFKVGDLEILVAGGGGGGGGSYCCGGGGAGGYGCATGGSGHFGNCNLYFGYNFCHPGAGGTVLTQDNWKVGYKGGDGYEDSGDTGGAGGKGKKLCSNGGAGGSGSFSSGYGGSGSSCASSGNGNSGDGYVRIYKYIG